MFVDNQLAVGQFDIVSGLCWDNLYILSSEVPQRERSSNLSSQHLHRSAGDRLSLCQVMSGLVSPDQLDTTTNLPSYTGPERQIRTNNSLQVSLNKSEIVEYKSSGISYKVTAVL